MRIAAVFDSHEVRSDPPASRDRRGKRGLAPWARGGGTGRCWLRVISAAAQVAGRASSHLYANRAEEIDE